MKAGDTVQFREPLADEVGELFTVLEMRGDRVLVESANPYFTIRPTFVYSVADMEVTQCLS